MWPVYQISEKIGGIQLSEVNEEYNKVKLVLKSLMGGVPVKIAGITYAMGENNDICQKVARYTYSKGVEVKHDYEYMGLQLPFMSFIRLCEKVTTEERVVIAANIVLNDIE